MTLLSELKRRNVIRMAGLYLVGAWLVLQVAETLLPILGTPEWVLKTLLLLLAIGFVPALVFAWVFELTPEGLRRDTGQPADPALTGHVGRRMDRLIFAGLMVLILAIAADRYWPQPAAVAPDASPVADTAPQPGTPSSANVATAMNANGIAVLPFVNMSADADNEYFSDGISEELLNVLVRIDGLDVASRTSSFAYKGSELGSRRIAEELQVNYLLEGSVRKAGNTVRITAQLIDAGKDRHLWSETYDRDLTDIFAIQDEIAKAIVAALRDELSSAAQPLETVQVTADTENLTAYENYLKARELFIARRDLGEAIRLFEKVVELDPGFARGWEGLAATYGVATSWRVDEERDFGPLTREAARKALELDPSLSMPWAALALADSDISPTDWTETLARLDKAVAADPHNATAFLWRGIVWMNLGFVDRAVQDVERCLAIDPAYPNCTRWKATVLAHTDPVAALALFEQGVARGFIGNRALDFAPLLNARGDRIGARLLLRESAFSPQMINLLMASLDNPSRPIPDWDAQATPADRKSALWDRPVLQLWFGNFDRVPEEDILSDMLIGWPTHRPEWQASPAFKRTMERTGIADYWRKSGFPPQCRATGKDDFECRPIGAR
ncbi:MAG: hypothetical protein DCF27_05685 [Lysobacteraceae bacterium]|nr:MAG: hypothetical protein DCF27_05685 [Xanthomonadaceae bacterium]